AARVGVLPDGVQRRAVADEQGRHARRGLLALRQQRLQGGENGAGATGLEDLSTCAGHGNSRKTKHLSPCRCRQAAAEPGTGASDVPQYTGKWARGRHVEEEG